MDTMRIVLQAPRHNIALLCSIIEGYEGVAVLRTVDPAQGLLELLVAPAFHTIALTLLHSLMQDLGLHLMPAGDLPPPGEP